MCVYDEAGLEAPRSREVEQVARLVDVRRDRFLHEEVQPRLQHRRADGVVQVVRRSAQHAVELQLLLGRQHRLEAGVPACAVPGGHFRHRLAQAWHAAPGAWVLARIDHCDDLGIRTVAEVGQVPALRPATATQHGNARLSACEGRLLAGGVGWHRRAWSRTGARAARRRPRCHPASQSPASQRRQRQPDTQGRRGTARDATFHVSGWEGSAGQ